MTNKLKCCFCGAELEKFGGGDFPLLHYCDNINCNLYHIMGQYTLWQELIRTRKALDVAKDTVIHADWFFDGDYNIDAKTMRNEIKRTIKEITALEQKDK